MQLRAASKFSGRKRALVLALSLALSTSFAVFTVASPARAEERHYRPEVMAHMQAGIKLLRERRGVEARQEFEEVIKQQPDLPDAYNNMALAYNYEGDNVKAQDWYRKALHVEPIYAPALNNLGLLLYSMGKPAEALKCLNRCLEISSNNQPDLYYYIGNAQRDLGHRNEARTSYIKAIQAKSDNAKAYSGLAVIDLDDGRLDDAFDEIKKAIQLNPNSAFSFFHLGLIEERRGHKDAAIAAYTNSLKFEKTAKYSAETRNRIAALRLGESGGGSPQNGGGGGNEDIQSRAREALMRHDWNAASKDLNVLAHGSASDDPIVWNNLGLALAGEGQNDQAVEAYRRAASLKSGGFSEAQYNLGMALRHMGDNRGAEQAFQKAVADSTRQHQTNPYAQNMLGIIYRERGDYDAADKAFRRAIIQAGNGLPVVHYNLGLLLEHSENSRDAVSEYKTYLKLAPQGKNAAACRQRLKRLTGA